MPGWPESVAVVGAAGVVGSGIVHELVRSGMATRVLAIDRQPDLLRAHLIDIQEAALVEEAAPCELRTAALADIGSVDVLVLAPSLPEGKQGDRLASLSGNLEIVAELAPALAATIGGDGVLLVVTNPVDIVATALRRMTSLRDHQVIGYSLNDSTRFRMAVARRLDVQPQRVDGTVLGEHGRTQVPLFSQLRLDGEPLHLDADSRHHVDTELASYFQHVATLADRSSGWTTPAGVMRALAHMRASQLLPSSVASGGAYGLPDTHLTLPSVLSRSGLADIEEWELDAQEHGRLHEAAAGIRDVADEALDKQ